MKKLKALIFGLGLLLLGVSTPNLTSIKNTIETGEAIKLTNVETKQFKQDALVVLEAIRSFDKATIETTNKATKVTITHECWRALKLKEDKALFLLQIASAISQKAPTMNLEVLVGEYVVFKIYDFGAYVKVLKIIVYDEN